VTGVSYDGGFPELVLDDSYRVLMGDVREVEDPRGGPTAAAASTDPRFDRALASYRDAR
jgi:hypothetical protein